MQFSSFLLGISLTLLSTSSFSQNKNETPGLRSSSFKENLFAGGAISAGFRGGSVTTQFTVGALPHFGYKFFDWLDAAVTFNAGYNSLKDSRRSYDYKHMQTNFGPGIFTRIYPAKSFFVQAHFEHNFMSIEQGYEGAGYFRKKFDSDASSLLVGVGYAHRRNSDNNNFFYVSVLFDVLKDENSPYVNRIYEVATSSYKEKLMPIIRVGYNMALFKNK